MLKLFHWEPNGAGARALLCLHEKGLPYESHYVDVLAFAQHEPDFLALNPQGQVPVLVNGETAYDQSSYLCEYLEETYPSPALMPGDPLGRWRVREWQKYVDDFLAPYLSELAWAAYSPRFRAGLGTGADALIERIVSVERRAAWRRGLGEASTERLARAADRAREAVTRTEADLARGAWLAGNDFSLADIAVFAYLNYLPRLLPALLGAPHTPLTAAWLARVAERPAVRAALATARCADPFAIASLGPEEVRWG